MVVKAGAWPILELWTFGEYQCSHTEAVVPQDAAYASTAHSVTQATAHGGDSFDRCYPDHRRAARLSDRKPVGAVLLLF